MILSHLIVTRRVPLEEDVGSPQVLCSVRVAQSLVFCAVFYRLMFVFFSVCHFTHSGYPFGIIKLFFDSVVNSLAQKTNFLYYHKNSSNITYWDTMQRPKDKRWSTTQYTEVTNVTKTWGKHMCSGRESSGTRSVTVKLHEHMEIVLENL